MKRPFLILLPLLALAAATTACHTPGALPPVSAHKFDLENDAKFVLLDKGAQRSVTVSRLQERTLPDGRLQVAANVLNLENRRIQVQINCVFKNDRGMAVDETPFETLILTENEQRTVSFVSMNDQATTYTIRVRQAR